MFTPKVFMIDDPELIRAFIAENGFAALVLAIDGDLIVDHLPFVLSGHETAFGVLRGHFARANRLSSRTVTPSTPAVAIFQGPHAYVSANHYPSKHRHGKMVPTWNYTVAHARGPVRLVDDADWLDAQMNALTTHHEAHRPDPWKVSDAPDDYVKKLARGVVGVEMVVEQVQCKWKLSQNQSAEDLDGVVDGLGQEGYETLVQYMRRARPS